MSSIFISHSSADGPAAREVADRLAGERHASVFLDFDPEKGIVAGQSWERTLYRKLRACRAVVAVVTDHYLASFWCFAEIALARMEGKHVFALQVDPLAPDAKLPSILTETQFIDLRTDPEEGYRRLWRGLREEDILGVAGEWEPHRSPYVGLDAFEERHAPVFFGREEESLAGVQLLERGAPGLIMVIGASGSGKSSIVRAGMLPRLRRDAGRWLIVDPFRPGGDPFAELATSLTAAYRQHAPDHRNAQCGWEELRARLVRAAAGAANAELALEAAPREPEVVPAPLEDDRLHRLMEQLRELRSQPPEQSGDRLLDFLDWSLEDLRRISRGLGHPPAKRAAAPTGDETLVEMAQDLRRSSPESGGARVLLVVDQFEELLGHDDPSHPANRFLDLLRAALEHEHSPLMALATMRSDFLGAFQRTPALRGIDFETLSVGSMKLDGMRKVIEEPALLGAVELEPGLADRLLQDTETPDALPLLSFTLAQLWRVAGDDGVLEVSEYEALGGLHGAVATEAEAVLAAARREGLEDELRRAFLRMARISEDGGYARRPVAWDDDELRPVQHLLELFIERRLLRVREEGDHRLVEVAHEVLFRVWEPLKGWLDEHRSELLLAAQIKRDAEIWDRAGRDPEMQWRGGRLQQAAELMRRQSMEPVEGDFITAGRQEEARIARRKLLITAGVVSVLTVLTGVSLFQWRRAESERVRALDIARVAVSQARLDADPTLAALILLEVENPEQTPYWAETARHAMNAGLSAGYPGVSALSAVAFSPDGSMIVAGDDAGGVVRMRADGRGSPRAFGDGHDGQVTSIAYTPDGTQVVTGSRDGTVRIWDASGDRVATLSGSGAQVSSISISPDGLVAAGSREVRVWHADGSLVTVFTEHEPSLVRSVTFGPRGERIASAAQDGSARVWRADGTGETVVMEGHTAPVTAVAFSPDGDRLATGSGEGTVRVWGTHESAAAQATLTRPPPADGDGVVAVAFLRGGARVAAGYGDGSVWLWDADGGEGVRLGAHAASLVSMDLSPDGMRLLTAARDGTARIWDLAGEGEYRTVRQPAALTAAAFSPAQGGGVVTVSVDGSVALWHGRQRSDPTVLARADGPLSAAAFSEDGAWMAMVGERDFEQWASVTRTDGGADPSVVTLAEHFDPVRWARVSPDGSHLMTRDDQDVQGTWALARGGARVSAPGGGEILAWVFDSGTTRFLTVSRDTVRIVTSGPNGLEETETLGSHTSLSAAGGGALDGAGRRAVTTSRQDGSIMLWDGRQGRTLHAPEADALERALFAAFSPDGELLVAVSSDSVARVWNASTGAPIATLAGHTGPITSAAFSPDGRRIVTASSDSTARIWRVDGGGDPVFLVDDRSAILAAVFAPDGQAVLTASANGVLHRWSTTTHARLGAALRSATNRCLDPPFRVEQLGERSTVAEEKYAACEAGHGRGEPAG